MGVRIARVLTLVSPVSLAIRLSIGVPRDAIVIVVGLRHMQIDIAITTIERTAAVTRAIVRVCTPMGSLPDRTRRS